MTLCQMRNTRDQREVGCSASLDYTSGIRTMRTATKCEHLHLEVSAEFEIITTTFVSLVLSEMNLVLIH